MFAGRNSAMEERLGFLAAQENLAPLGEYLLAMNNSAFRIAGALLSDKVLPKLEGENFWRVFEYLALLNPKAFLGTCLKPMVVLYRQSKLEFSGPSLERYARVVDAKEMGIDRNKFFMAALPLLRKEDEFAFLWKSFGVDSPQSRIDYLRTCSNAKAYYEIFKECKKLQDKHGILVDVCRALVKKGDGLSFNLASVLREYFGLGDLGVLFSLNIEPYKLNYLDRSAQNFEKILTSL